MNEVHLTGRLVADPELRHTANDVAVTSFAIAVDRPAFKGKEKVTDFLDIVAWKNTAEFICKYFKKGQMIIIVNGAIQTRSYTDKDNNKRKVWEILANKVEFDGSANHNGQAHNEQQGQSQPADNGNSAPAYSSGDTGDFEDIPSDDDLPF